MLQFCAGALTIILTIVVIWFSETMKAFKSWDGRYVGLSWLTIWRAERALKRGDIKRHRELLGHRMETQ